MKVRLYNKKFNQSKLLFLKLTQININWVLWSNTTHTTHTHMKVVTIIPPINYKYRITSQKRMHRIYNYGFNKVSEKSMRVTGCNLENSY